MFNKKIAIIIVTCNASEYLGELFSSLEKNEYPREDFEIVVIDNASTDDTLTRIKNHESRIMNLRLITSTKNTGFAEGNNIGLRYALERNFDYAYLLNQDTVVDPNFLWEAVTMGESDEKIGVVQSLLMLWPQKDLVNSWGNEIHYLGFAYSGGYKEKITDYLSTPRLGSEDPSGSETTSSRPRGGLRITDKEIAYASGAACLVKLSALKEIGLFNKDFFMYHEDVDLGWRLWLAGYRVVLAPKSIVYHKYEFQRSIKKYYFMERNRYMVLVQNYSFLTLLVILPALCLLDIAMLFYSVFGGFWREEVRAFTYFCSINNWKKIIATRKIVQGTRKVSDKDILKHFTGVIAFQDVQNPLVKYIFNPIFQAYFFLVKIVVRW